MEYISLNGMVRDLRAFAVYVSGMLAAVIYR